MSHDHSPQAYIKPRSSQRAASNRRQFFICQIVFHQRIRPEMIDVSMHASSDQDLGSGGRSRQRSHSYYSSEDSKKYGGQTQTEDTFLRPRSRSFYSYETSEHHTDYDTGSFTGSSSPQQRASSILQYQVNKKEKREENGASVRVTSKKSKFKPNKRSPTRELNGSKGNLKSVSMMTISESDNWEICSSSGMKYGQFVDWEKIDPEAAIKYQQILQSDHQQLKTMGREGFWAMPHTLRAKAYYHIIHSINTRSVTPDRDTHSELVKTLFGEHKISSHPVPEYMEAVEIPRYCLNKAGLNSVKRILLCLGKSFPDMNFCPILPELVSLLLHFSEDEAECFHSVSRLICYNDPNKRYIDQTFLTYRASCMTFGDLANRCCRGIRKLIASSHQNLFEFYSDWIMWIFADLPFTYAIRVLDVYILEGYKVLYRVALTLLNLYKVSVSSRVADVEDFRTDMKRFVQSVARHCTVDKLLERAFMIPMATRRELNLLFNANKDALMQKGVSTHQKRQSVETVDFNNFTSSVVTGTEMRVVWAWIPERFALFSPIRLFNTAEHGRSLASFYSHVEGHEPVVLMIKTMGEEVFGAFLSTDVIERRKHDSDGLTYFGTGECFVFTLRPNMEHYQQTMVNIMTRRSSPQQPRDSSRASSQVSNSGCSPTTTATATLTCPAGTPQDPSYLTIPFTAPAEEPMTAKEPKRPKEQEASMFIAGSDSQLVIGGNGGHALCLQEDLEGGYSEPCDTFKSIPLCKGHFKIQALEVWGIQNSISFSHCFPSQ
ncbi:TBC1 domain family member 24-like [Centropristis striata]|uniref:TBC1 domain family member 24-like n=1 Tax=Centropristis striata TaxID=184440 RepID=UPI0027DF5117|nr:TBC1 domain family member 24-like [Centropristis striata]